MPHWFSDESSTPRILSPSKPLRSKPNSAPTYVGLSSECFVGKKRREGPGEPGIRGTLEKRETLGVTQEKEERSIRRRRESRRVGEGKVWGRVGWGRGMAFFPSFPHLRRQVFSTVIRTRSKLFAWDGRNSVCILDHRPLGDGIKYFHLVEKSKHPENIYSNICCKSSQNNLLDFSGASTKRLRWRSAALWLTLTYMYTNTLWFEGLRSLVSRECLSNRLGPPLFSTGFYFKVAVLLFPLQTSCENVVCVARDTQEASPPGL